MVGGMIVRDTCGASSKGTGHGPTLLRSPTGLIMCLGASPCPCHAVIRPQALNPELDAQEEKDKISIQPRNPFRGYQALGVNVTNGKPDQHEGLDLV